METKQVMWGKDNRCYLHTVLPLNTPFTIMIGVTNRCNFKCRYCIHSLSNDKLKSLNYITDDMSYELFTKIIDDAKKFPNKIKALQILKDGEPMLNKNISEMISYAKSSNKFGRVELITNGSLLNPKVNLELINAGLDTLRISLQGINREKYYEITNIHINFDRFVRNIKHFYENKKGCKLHLKMIDIGIDNSRDMKIFHDIYKNMCDEYSIQNVVSFYNNHINVDKIQRDFNANIYGIKKNENNESNKIRVSNIYVCSRPFMSMSISTNGDVLPCCQEPMKDLIMGNVNNESIFDIWNNEKMRLIRVSHLKREKFKYTTCEHCHQPEDLTYEEDNLDNYTKKLIEYYDK